MKRKILESLVIVAVVGLALSFSVPAHTDGNYRGTVDKIGVLFREALELYGKGNVFESMEKVQAAYFEGFEDLEGPIEENISEGKSHELEEEFADIRRMIKEGEPLSVIENRIDALMAELKDTAAALEGGFTPVGGGVEEETIHRDWSAVAAVLFNEIEEAVSLYEDGQEKSAVLKVQDSYFDQFEESGMEAEIGAMDPAFKTRLESHFSMMVGLMQKGTAPAQIRSASKEMKEDFQRAVVMLKKRTDTPMTLFFYSLTIILREGFEAILIITAIIAYLLKTGNRDKLRVIYNGCAAGLVLSVITAVLVKWVFKASAASQEILEGATMLLATVVLFSVSYWLISKAESKRWVAYIQNKVNRSLSSGSLNALWFAAFLAVYREGAETVLFYQALGADAGALGIGAILGGFGIGCALLAALYALMRFGSLKMPIKPFFIATGALLYYMALVFAGRGAMELIEGQLFEPSLVSWVPTIPFIGVYPYLQTLIPQVVLIMAALAGFAIIMKRRPFAHHVS